MSELAFDKNGNRIRWSDAVKALRVSEANGKRGPQSPVYGRNGTPLIVDRDVTYSELRDAVSTAGRLRLDPLDDEYTHLEAEPSAYVVVHDDAKNPTPVVMPSPASAVGDAKLLDANVELTRQSFEFAKHVTSLAMANKASALTYYVGDKGVSQPLQLVEVMRSMGSRPDGDDRDHGDDDDDDVQSDDASSTPAPSGTAEMLKQVIKVVEFLAPMLSALSKVYPPLGVILRGAVPSTDSEKSGAAGSKASTARPGSATANTQASGPSAHENTPSEPDRNPIANTTADDGIAAEPGADLSPSAMMHAYAVQQALDPEEREQVEKIAGVMTDGERAVWLRELGRLDVDAAVKVVREALASEAQTGAAS